MPRKKKATQLYFVCAVVFFSIVLGTASQVTANQSPVAVALPENQTIYAGGEAWFSANDSYDPDGNITSYFWDFKDGTSSSDPYTTHSYNLPGNYTVTLTVTDDLGATDQDSVNITVIDSPPGNVNVWIQYLDTDKEEYERLETINATVIVQRDSGDEPQTWYGTQIFEVFNDTMVLVYYDEREVILPEVSPSGISLIEFNLSQTGDHIVRASLYDNNSVFVHRKEIGVKIKQDPMNQMPIAIASADAQTVNMGVPVDFFGHMSHDPDGYLVSYLWEFGDGGSDFGENSSHVYDTPGEYPVTLTVTDDLDATSADSMAIWVLDPANEPPVAEARCEPKKVKVGEEVRFYGDSSQDPDGVIISYHWDFGDGNHSTKANPSHVYGSSGTYSVILTVSDNDYAKRTDTVTLKVVSQPERIKDGPLSNWGYLGAITVFGILTSLAVTYATEEGRYRFLGFFIPLYTKLKKEEILDHFTRGKIYGYIVANPGDHYNSIKKALKLPDGSFAHHIHILEKEGIIKSARDGTYRRFYPPEMKVPDNGGSLKKSQLLIIDSIKETPGISQKDIASILGVSSATVNYHLKELIRLGIVKAERAGMRMRYYINSENVDIDLEAITGGKLKKTQEKKYIDLS
ncbi:MAG: PKD domain-containing protein [Thermoplasmata archaeon]|nr:MAG: PKD domain-containing protein [Thermoplasmata archaeon]